MELLLVVAISVVVGALIYFNRSSRGLDANQDGKIDATDASTFIDNTVGGVKRVLDVNQDGRVDAEDAKAAVKAVAKTAKKAAVKAKTATRSAAKKPAAKKPTKK